MNYIIGVDNTHFCVAAVLSLLNFYIAGREEEKSTHVIQLLMQCHICVLHHSDYQWQQMI